MDLYHRDLITRTMFESFKNWGSKDEKYRKYYKKLHIKCFDIVLACFSEINQYKPGVYELWWAQEHMRFKGVSNENMRLLHELMYVYLTRYARGTLHAERNEQLKTNRKHRRKNEREKAKQEELKESNNKSVEGQKEKAG